MNISPKLIVLLNQYEIIQKLGQGNFTIVFKAKHKQNDNIVAIKCIDKDKHVNKIKNTNIKELRNKLFQTEITNHSLCKSKNILQFFEIIDSHQWKVIIIQYCHDGTLYQKINKQGALSQQQSIFIFEQLIIGFAILQKNKIKHLALRTSNIYIHKKVYKMTDFGLTHIKKKLIDFDKNLIHSFNFTSAPQIMNDQQSDASCCDMWDLGVVLYQMLTNRLPPTTGQNDKDILKIHQSINILRISETLKNFLKSIFVRNCKQRLKWFELFKMYNNKQEIFHSNSQINKKYQSYIQQSCSPLTMKRKAYSTQQQNSNSNNAQNNKNKNKRIQMATIIINQQTSSQKCQDKFKINKLQKDMKIILQIQNKVISPLKTLKTLKTIKEQEYNKLSQRLTYLKIMAASQIIKIGDQNKYYLEMKQFNSRNDLNNREIILTLQQSIKRILKIRCQDLDIFKRQDKLNILNILKLINKNKDTKVSNQELDSLQSTFLFYNCSQKDHIKATILSFQKLLKIIKDNNYFKIQQQLADTRRFIQQQYQQKLIKRTKNI